VLLHKSALNLQSSEAAEAGRLYVQKGALAKSLLRHHVYRAWERSHLQKASALAMKAEGLSQIETLPSFSKRSSGPWT
jgi:transcriptional regulator of acetoin/glycerol metabolism